MAEAERVPVGMVQVQCWKCRYVWTAFDVAPWVCPRRFFPYWCKGTGRRRLVEEVGDE